MGIIAYFLQCVILSTTQGYVLQLVQLKKILLKIIAEVNVLRWLRIFIILQQILMVYILFKFKYR